MTGDRNGPLGTDLTPVADAVAGAGADAFVAVGDRFDDGVRYLTRFVGPDQPYGLVIGPGAATTAPRAILLAPEGFGTRAERAFVDAARTTRAGDGGPAAAGFHDGVGRSVRTDRVDDPVGVRAAAVVDGWRDDERGGERTGGNDDGTDGGGHLLVPRSIPHDAAVYLQRARYDLASTPIVAEIRAIKTPTEIDRLRRVQLAAAAGMARAETIVARSEPVEGSRVDSTDEPRSDADEGAVLGWDGDDLTTGRLRRALNATLAECGVRDAGNTAVVAGAGTTDHRGFEHDVVRPGETVRIDLAPRGPDGYYGALGRTFVVDGDGGWARRADVAVGAARNAGLAAVEPGESVASVNREVTAEAAAYGFDPGGAGDEADAVATPRTGHGVGLSRHESPSPTGDAELRPGHVLTVGSSVSDPEHGGVRLADLIVVTEDGHEVLAEYPLGTVPEARE